MRRPAFQFYPADWRKDNELQSCSIGARGLWIEIMCLAHESELYGHLVVNEKAMNAQQIGRRIGVTERECQRFIAELEDSGVLSRTDDGVIFSRRMVRDERIRNARATGGEAGAEHGHKGAEHGSKGGRPRKDTGDKKPPLEPPSKPAPSSSTSLSSSPSEDSPSLRSGGPPPRPKASKRSLPEGFPDDGARDWARQHWLAKGRTDLCDAMDDEAAKFRDHHVSQAKTSADWPGSWRTWVRNAMNFSRAPRNGAGSQPAKIFGIKDLDLDR